MRAGVDGLLREKTRPSRIPALAQVVIDRVIERTREDPSGAQASAAQGAQLQALAPGCRLLCRPHVHPKVMARPTRHPRFISHATLTSCSWLKAIENFLATLTKHRLKRGLFPSIADLQAAIKRFLEQHNDDPKPVVWTADPDHIIAAGNRGHQALQLIQ